jgi:Ser/Thr protein kinase RdoA (MazF antagonist)
MLEHLKASNVGVAAPFRTSNGCLMVDVSAPEGVRPLVLFEYIEAVTPRGNEEENARLVGAELARIHAASGTYTGPASMYELNADHLIRRPLAAILQLEHLNAELTKGLAQVADELAEAVEAVDLRHVTCHGDCHGGNSIITKGPDGKHRASFFDFDDGGPGFLAYDLSVFLWAQLLGRRQSEPDDEVANLWKAFIEGYRTGADIPAPDMKSVMTFVAVRMLWLLGEYAGNVSQWAGTVSVPNQWVKKNFDFLSVWRTLKTPE